MARYYAIILHEYAEDMGELSDSEFGRLIRGLLQYSITGVEPKFNGNEKHYWRRVKRVEDEHKASYQNTCTTNRENGKKGGRPKKTEITEGNPPVPTESEKRQLESKFKSNTQSPNGDMSIKEKEEARAHAMSCYMDKISPEMSRETLSMLPAYTDSLGQDAVLYAIETAIDNNARKWPYIKAILQDLSQAGVHNADSLERYRKERKQREQWSQSGCSGRVAAARDSAPEEPRRYAGETVL